MIVQQNYNFVGRTIRIEKGISPLIGPITNEMIPIAIWSDKSNVVHLGPTNAQKEKKKEAYMTKGYYILH